MSAGFTNICPPVPSHWANKETATIYDMKTKMKIAIVPSYPYRTREEAKKVARQICNIFNEILTWQKGTIYDPRKT